VLQRGEQLHVAEFVIVVVVLCRWTDTQTDDMTTKSSLLAPHRSSDTQVSDAVAWNSHSFFVRSIASKRWDRQNIDVLHSTSNRDHHCRRLNLCETIHTAACDNLCTNGMFCELFVTPAR